MHKSYSVVELAAVLVAMSSPEFAILLILQTLVASHRQLRMLTPTFEVRDHHRKEKAHPRIVFVFNDMVVVCALFL